MTEKEVQDPLKKAVDDMIAERRLSEGKVAALSSMIVLCTLMLETYTIKMLWHWFIVPQSGFPELAYMTAFGLSLLVTVVTPHIDMSRVIQYERTYMDMWLSLWAQLVRPGIYLISGWAVHFLFS